MEVTNLVDEKPCVELQTSKCPTEMSTTESLDQDHELSTTVSLDQDSCTEDWSYLTSDFDGAPPSPREAASTTVAGWENVSNRLSRVFQRVDLDEEGDDQDNVEDLGPDMAANFRPPPGLTLEPKDSARCLTPDLGTPPGLTINTAVATTKDEVNAWRLLSLRLAGVVADPQSEEMDM